jgi:hypothetical protein
MPQDYCILMATTTMIIRINNKIDGKHWLHEGTQSFHHDMTSQGYEGLMIGWVGEERHMPHGRIYKVILFFIFLSFFVSSYIYIWMQILLMSCCCVVLLWW